MWVGNTVPLAGILEMRHKKDFNQQSWVVGDDDGEGVGIPTQWRGRQTLVCKSLSRIY